MIATLNVDYKDRKFAKVLLIDESTGVTTPYYCSTTDKESLEYLYNLLQSGVTYADFTVKKHEDGSMSLAHGAESYVANELLSTTGHNVPIKDGLTFVGFIRQMIVQGGMYLVREEEGVTEVPNHNVVPCRTTKFNKFSEIQVSHKVPGYTEGKWRWTTTSILTVNEESKFNSYSGQRFLCPLDADLGEYEDYVVEHDNVVIQEYGTEYRCLTVKEGLPVFAIKHRTLVSPAVISRLNLILDTYKASLYTLTDGLFQPVPMEYSNSKKSNSEERENIFVFLITTHKVDRALSDIMFDFLVKDKSGKLSEEDKVLLNRSFPLYKGYKTIVASQFALFVSDKVSFSDKMVAYDALTKNEALVRLLLAEFLYTTMFGSDFLARYWMLNNNFDSKLHNYPVYIRGGGAGAKIFTDN